MLENRSVETEPVHIGLGRWKRFLTW